MGDLDGRRALVTGAAGGIGQSIAWALGDAGASVAMHTANSAPDETLARLRDGVAVKADLREVEACRAAVDEAAGALGGLDILVNCAGLTQATPFAEVEPAQFDKLFALNIRGYYFCTQAALRHLEAAGGGTVVNVTSVHAHASLPGHSVYAATKGAIVSLTRQLAIELAPHRIRVNAVGPGLIEVERYFDDPAYSTDAGSQSIPLGRVGYPSDVGPTVAFLCSPQAEFITGQTLYIDGGSTAQLAIDVVPR